MKRACHKSCLHAVVWAFSALSLAGLSGCGSDFDEPQEPSAGPWSVAFGSNDNYGGPQAGTVSVSTAGNLIITGTFNETIDLGGGEIKASAQPNFFVAKYSASGEPIWSAKGGGGDDFAQGAAMDADGNAVLAGSFNGKVDLGSGELSGNNNLFLSRYSPSGEPLWSKSYGIDQEFDSITGTAVSPDGNIYLTGRAGGSLNFGGGALAPGQWQTMFVAKLDSSGKAAWARGFSTVNYIESRDIAIDGKGNTFIMGSFSGDVDLGGGPLGNFDSYGYYIAKFDANGKFAWSKGYAPQNGGLYIVDLAADAEGNVIMAGHMNDTVDFGGGPLTSTGFNDIFLVKLGSDGSHRFSKRFGAADNYQQLAAAAVDGGGNIYLGGTFEQTLNFGTQPLQAQAGGSDLFLAKFDGSGNAVESKSFGGPSWESLRSMTVDNWGNAILFGQFNTTIDFGMGVLDAGTGSKLFLARIK